VAATSTGVARVAALALLWVSSFLWIKVSLEAFTPVQVTVLRMALGSALLLLILRIRRLRRPRRWAVRG